MFVYDRNIPIWCGAVANTTHFAIGNTAFDYIEAGTRQYESSVGTFKAFASYHLYPNTGYFHYEEAGTGNGSQWVSFLIANASGTSSNFKIQWGYGTVPESYQTIATTPYAVANFGTPMSEISRYGGSVVNVKASMTAMKYRTSSGTWPYWKGLRCATRYSQGIEDWDGRKTSDYSWENRVRADPGRGLLMKRLVLATIAVVTLSTGCGDPSAQQLRPAASPSNLPQPPRRPIDWDHPLMSHVAATRVTAKAQGRLGFDPVVPNWTVRESAVEVTDPATRGPMHSSVAFIYDFPIGPEFPTNGRVVVVETPTMHTDADLAKIAESHRSDEVRVIVVNGRPALLIEGAGVGRVHLIRRGMAIDITGPATSPESVVRLAETLG